MANAFITGLAGHVLSADERTFLREADPWGIILFTRNIGSPDQVRRLTGDCRDALARADAPILVDQEGGRVQRLGPPHWPAYPPAAFYGGLYDRDPAVGMAAARLAGRLIAADLSAVGITVDCLPVADVPVAAADPIIGDRAYGTTPGKVAALAAAIAEGLMEGGVLPVLKHMPGHGRATADSHLRLPRVEADRATLERTDFAAFRPLRRLPLGMTAHVVFSAIDPVEPATTSRTIIEEVIRDSIGFDGALMSDDIEMQALSGTMAERARAVIAAGCDLVLHCHGGLDEKQAVAAAAPRLEGERGRRTAAALAARLRPTAIDLAVAREEFSAMAGQARRREVAGS